MPKGKDLQKRDKRTSNQPPLDSFLFQYNIEILEQLKHSYSL